MSDIVADEDRHRQSLLGVGDDCKQFGPEFVVDEFDTVGGGVVLDQPGGGQLREVDVMERDPDPFAERGRFVRHCLGVDNAVDEPVEIKSARSRLLQRAEDDTAVIVAECRKHRIR